MDFYVGNTDWLWFNYLRSMSPPPEDIDFWKPSETAFKAIPIGAPFLFRLKSPRNAIGGLGFFSGYHLLPLKTTWETFDQRTGCDTFTTLMEQITRYRAKNGDHSNPLNALVGCIALTEPIFFDDEDFIPGPVDWAAPIVSGKTYSTSTVIGAELWQSVQERLQRYRDRRLIPSTPYLPSLPAEQWLGYSGTTQQKVRIGQGAFRILVTNAYESRCAVTGESVVSVLEAAHIRDYAEQGPNLVRNGLLLRADIHKLFDAGLITVTPNHHIEVAQNVHGLDMAHSKYQSLHGTKLLHLPQHTQDIPDPQFLSWHNENRFRG